MADPVEERIARVERDPRKQWGWGPSALASNEERDAWRVAAGERPRDIRNDPAFREWAYNEGGYAKSRRTMRMQQEWQKQQQEDIKMQAALQAMEIQQKQFEMNERDQFMKQDDFYYNRGLKEADQKLKAQQLSEATAIIGGLNQLDPRDPDYQQKRAKIFGDNPLGAADPNVQKVANEYGAANTVYVGAAEKAQADEEARVKAETQGRVAIAKDLAANGLSIADYSKDGVVDFEAANTALGEKLKEKEEGKEERASEAEERRALRRQKSSAETELVKIKAQVGRFEQLRPTKDNLRELEAARISQGIFEDEINRINRELGGGEEEAPQPQSFDTPEEADAANLPKGTIVVIGGRRARID